MTKDLSQFTLITSSLDADYIVGYRNTASGGETRQTFQSLRTSLLPYFTGSGGSTSGSTAVANLAALRATSVTGLTTGATIIVNGHTTIGDGGGGNFWFESGATWADDNGVVIAPDGGGTGRWYRIIEGPFNVKWLGAVGDGTTDDTNAISQSFNWWNNHPQLGGELNCNGSVYVPRGRYKITKDIKVTNAYGLTIFGDSAYASAIEYNTTTGSALYIHSYRRFQLVDVSIYNPNGGGNNPLSQTGSNSFGTGSNALVLYSDGTGTFAHIDRCIFTNWSNCVRNGGTLSGDTGLYTHCRFNHANNAWYSDNAMSGIQTFQQCGYDLVHVGGVNTQGVGMIHIDTPNFVGKGSLLYLRPVFAEWGAASNYIVTNGKMEWAAPASRWVTMPGTASGLPYGPNYGNGTFTFNNCSMSGGDNGEVTMTSSILKLCGTVNLQWNGGNFGGTVEYEKNDSLTHADPATYNTRTEIVFNGAKYAPTPDKIIITGNGSEPTFVWRGNGNMLDLEMGGSMGYNQRTPHTLKYQQYYYATTQYDKSSPYTGSINFNGRTVRIDSALHVWNAGTLTAGTKTAKLYSDSGYSTVIASGSFSGTTGSPAVNTNVALINAPVIISDKLYTEVALTANETCWGYWLIDYTVLE